MRLQAEEVARRRRNAAELEEAAQRGVAVTPIRAVAGAQPGYLRFPVIETGRRGPVAALGITRGYPRALYEQDELRPHLHPEEREPRGGRLLRESLFTLPVHGHLTARDRRHLRHWLETPGFAHGA
jgi:hypothetical protein